MKNITDSERIIMDILWDESPLSAAEVIRRAKLVEPWADNTIRTFLSRLHDKGLVKITRGESVNLYSAAISFEKTRIEVVRTAIDKMFDGSVKNMMVSFIDGHELSQEEIDDLKSLLEGIGK